jgi:hypothetical protein
MKPATHQYEDKLLELAYGELPAHEASAVEGHVRGCARCTEALNEIRAVRSAMGQLPMVEPPEAGLESLFAYAEQAARRNAAGPAPQATWWRKLIAPLGVVTALGIVAIVGVRVLNEKEGGELPRRDEIAVTAQSKVALEAAPSAPAAPAVVPEPEAAPVGGSANAPAAVATAAPAPKEEEDAQLQEAKPAEKKLAKVAALQKPAKPSPSKAAELDDMIQAAAKNKEHKEQQQADRGDDAYAYDKAPAPKKKAEVARKTEETKADDSKRPSDMSNAYGPGSKDVAGGYYAKESRTKADKNADSQFGLSTGAADKPQAVAEREAPPPVVAAQPSPSPSQAQAHGQVAQAAPGGGGKRGEPAPDDRQNAAPEAPPPPPLAQGASPYQQQAMPRTSASGSLSLKGASNDEDVASTRDGLAARKQVADNIEANNRRVVTELDAQVAAARRAEQQADFQTEYNIAVQILRHEPAGTQRMQALQSACTATQQLGLADLSTKYCSALMNEFPGNPIGQRWAENQRRASPAPARERESKKARSYDDAEKAASPPAAPASQQLSH